MFRLCTYFCLCSQKYQSLLHVRDKSKDSPRETLECDLKTTQWVPSVKFCVLTQISHLAQYHFTFDSFADNLGFNIHSSSGTLPKVSECGGIAIAFIWGGLQSHTVLGILILGYYLICGFIFLGYKQWFEKKLNIFYHGIAFISVLDVLIII